MPGGGESTDRQRAGPRCCRATAVGGSGASFRSRPSIRQPGIRGGVGEVRDAQSWAPGFPLHLFEDPELQLPASTDRAAGLSAWHMEREWMRVAHRCQYSNAVIGITEELSPVADRHHKRCCRFFLLDHLSATQRRQPSTFGQQDRRVAGSAEYAQTPVFFLSHHRSRADRAVQENCPKPEPTAGGCWECPIRESCRRNS
jgi:hypothetical protein